MSLEPEIAPPTAEMPPVPAPASTDDDANLRAALLPHVGSLVPGAEAIAFRLLREELKGVAPTLLPAAIEARLASADFAPLVTPPPAPNPFSRESIVANYQAAQPSRAGTRTTPDGRKVWTAAGKSAAQQRADMEAHQAAAERREAAAQFARELAALPPGAARLEHLAAAVRAGRDAQGSPPALKTRPRSK